MKFDKLYEQIVTEKLKSKEKYEEVDRSKINIRSGELGIDYDEFTSDTPKDEAPHYGARREYKIKKNGWTFHFALSTDYYTMPSEPNWHATKGKMLVGMFDEKEIVRATSKEDYATFLKDQKLKSIDDILSAYDWSDV
jgi:hypothetical protein